MKIAEKFGTAVQQKKLKSLAQAVGAVFRFNPDGDLLHFIGKDREPFVSAHSLGDAEEVIQAYYGGHENFQEAWEEYQ